MTSVHRVRLQAAWHAAGSDPFWTRSFGKPVGLECDDRVWLVIERAAACSVALNGSDLPSVAAGMAVWRHDVTDALRERNELRLRFAVVAEAGIAVGRRPLPDPLGTVSLEIVSIV